MEDKTQRLDSLQHMYTRYMAGAQTAAHALHLAHILSKNVASSASKLPNKLKRDCIDPLVEKNRSSPRRSWRQLLEDKISVVKFGQL